ncbi:aspartic proteinase precursor [Hyaloscypha bicolor E]|uniref:Probable aspartic-type endopeptidase OPSB n=1 Tax=Hyaloscypha bicolor E TaxID=1095630 RepID=A0A2J6TPY7_9HELO|nr:aspartic proteinase precursor [Hyaloscypha bicolor E]PMD65086.1 aspartic proteinase precursor [Hyaloscypha bicolor E]
MKDALYLQRRTDAAPRVVGFPVERKFVPNPILRDRLRRRASTTVQASLQNEETLYFANGTLGTPAQSLRLHLDTGSSDLWVNTPTSALCKSKGSPCASAGTYTANSSSTYSYIASDFNISYVDGSGASGDYVSDTFTIGGTKLDKLQFGIGYTSSSSDGILGIGYQINEVQVGRAGKAAYNNLPAQLVADGVIQSNAFSLWLNDLDASIGSILFGGVDTEKYTGTLTTLPIQKESGFFAEFLITLTEVTLGSTVIAKNQAQAVLLDSGSSLTYLPDAMTEAIYEQVSAQYSAQDGAAFVPCSLASNTTTLDFTFSSPTISIPMNELVIPATTANGRPLVEADGTKVCLFGIAPAGSSTAVLGDTFIRSAYLVYDLANNEISIAQTKFNATATNVVEITTGSSAVPDATAVANPVAASAGTGSNNVASGLGTSTSKAAAQRTAAPVHFGAFAAVGAGMFYAAM